MQSQPASIALVEMRGIVKRFPGVLALARMFEAGLLHSIITQNIDSV